MSGREPRNLAASLLVAGFHGRSLPGWVADALRDGLAGVILFERNVESLVQVASLVREVRAASPGALVCVDQEGGRVQRLGPQVGFVARPSARALAERGDPEAARRAAREMGDELRSVGFDISFAPVLDVDTNPDNPVIGDRSFSRDPQQVAAYGIAVAHGLAAAKVIACAKHFPGHGDTSVDSHLALPVIGRGLERLRQVEWVPFGAAVKAGIPAVMTAHVLVRAIDPDHPATLSRANLRFLREELGFGGCIVSDDLEMKAVRDRYDPAAAARLALDAGVDLMLVCSREDDLHEAWRALETEATTGGAARARVGEAAARVTALRQATPPAMPLDDEALRSLYPGASY